jgi:type IV secretion system protein VirB11
MNRLQRGLTHCLGDMIVSALKDPEVIEVIANSDGRIWIDRISHPMVCAGTMDESEVARVVSLVASDLEQIVDRDHPFVEGELPLDGSRFTGVMPPAAARAAFSIRKKAGRIFTLDDYVSADILDPVHAAVIRSAVQDRKNILVVGGTGSGKTTLVNAILQEIAHSCPNDRLVIIEDTSELQCSSANFESLHTSAAMGIQALVRLTMRLRPDRIIVGEVRGGEALDLLKSWNTGHPGGVCTVHANSAWGGLLRLEQLIAEASTSPIPVLIGEAVDLVLFIERTRTGRRVSEVATVSGFDHQTCTYIMESINA